MKHVVTSALVLTALVAVLSVLVALTGIHRSNPLMANAVFILPAIAINIGCIVWGLRGTRSEAGYLRQVGNGVLIGLIAGVLIFAFSVLMLTVLMPGYLEEVKEATVIWLQEQPISEEVRSQQIAAVQATRAWNQALGGLIGTFGTSVVTALVAAIFLRRK